MTTRRLVLDAERAFRITVKAAFPDDTRNTSLAENLSFSSFIKRPRCLLPQKVLTAQIRCQKEKGAEVGGRVRCGIMADTSQYVARSDLLRSKEGLARER